LIYRALCYTMANIMAEKQAKKPVKKALATSKAAAEKPAAKKAVAKKATPKAEKKGNPEEFAVIETGGKQYVVCAGDVVTIEKLPGDFAKGDTVTFDKVLLVDDGRNATIGTPYINGAKVIGTFQEGGKGKKVVVIKYKQKSRYFKKRGHRQPYFKVKIESLK